MASQNLQKAIFFILFSLLISCNSNSQEKIIDQTDSSNTSKPISDCYEIKRDIIREKLTDKIKSSKAFFVHILVPLCDNINQGIVPTSKSLGNGLNLKTNLYWGAGYGVKTYFKRKADWKLIKDTFYVEQNILERVVFFKKFKNNAKVYLIADAYRGDKMKECVDDFLNSLAGINKGSIKIDTNIIGYSANADFLIFNGHNGLMDAYSDIRYTKDKTQRDAAVIACISKEYFLDYFRCSHSYPLVTTTSLLPPEAYVAEAIINAWALMKTNEEIRISAGDAMAKVHKKPQKGMRRMFATGW